MNAYLSLIEKGRGGCLLTFFTFRMGAYSSWALIRGWALIRINTVDPKATFEPAQAYYGFLLFFSSLCIRSPQLTHRRENRDIRKLQRRRQRECLKHKRFRKHNNNSLSTCITLFTSAEREVKVSRRSGMYQSYNFLTRLGMQSL